MKTSIQRIQLGLSLVLGIFVIAIGGYMLAGATFIDALYMVVITIFSVGYEETVPIDSPALRAFTIVIILVGCSSLLYVTGGFFQMVMEGEVTRALGHRKSSRDIECLRDHAIICGFGRMGQIIAKELSLSKFPFVVVEKSSERADEARQRKYLVLEGDATEERTLAAAGVGRAQTLATVLPNDAINVFITLSARNLNAKINILARGEVPTTERKLMQAGADHVVLPAAIGGIRLAQMIVKPSASHLLDNLENTTMINDDLAQLGVLLSEVKVQENSYMANRTVGDIEHEPLTAHLVCAVRRQNGSVVRRPHCDFVVYPGDTVILIGHEYEAPDDEEEAPESPVVMPSAPEPATES